MLKNKNTQLTNATHDIPIEAFVTAKEKRTSLLKGLEDSNGILDKKLKSNMSKIEKSNKAVMDADNKISTLNIVYATMIDDLSRKKAENLAKVKDYESKSAKSINLAKKESDAKFDRLDLDYINKLELHNCHMKDLDIKMVDKRSSYDDLCTTYDDLCVRYSDVDKELILLLDACPLATARELIDKYKEVESAVNNIHNIEKDTVDVIANLNKYKQDTLDETAKIQKLRETGDDISNGVSNSLFNNLFKDNSINYLVMLQYSYYSGIVSNASKELRDGVFVGVDMDYRNFLNLDKFSVVDVYKKFSKLDDSGTFHEAVKEIDMAILGNSHREYLINLLKDLKDKPSDVKTYIINEAIDNLSKHYHKLEEKYK